MSSSLNKSSRRGAHLRSGGVHFSDLPFPAHPELPLPSTPGEPAHAADGDESGHGPHAASGGGVGGGGGGADHTISITLADPAALSVLAQLRSPDGASPDGGGGRPLPPALPHPDSPLPSHDDADVVGPAVSPEVVRRALRQELQHDDVCGRSQEDSDADGPLLIGIGAGGVDGVLSGAEGGAVDGVAAAMGLPGALAGGHGSRRHGHHRGAAGKAKAAKAAKAQNAAVMRTWLKVDRSGDTTILQADKWRITHKLGIQTRDLRLLDPNMSTTYPSAILCRDKAIVVNLEHLKVIITTTFVLVVNPEDEKVLRFIDDLKGRLAAPGVIGGLVGGMTQSRSYQALSEADRLKYVPSPSNLGLDLPFELKALEVCLDTMASHLDFLTQELEASAYPALDALANKVSSPHLERVRRIKNNLVRMTTRVETVREVLEKFLDDDSDMHDLNLTAKEAREQEELRAVAEAMNQAEARSTISTSGRSSDSSSDSSASSDSSVEEAETAMVEMLLETYFMHVDNTYNKLQTLHEYIGDTEDLVNIKLDQHRNQLITIDLMLTALTTVLAMMTALAGWFGMNLNSGLQEAPGAFVQVTVTSSVVGLSLFVAFIIWLWRSKLLIT